MGGGEEREIVSSFDLTWLCFLFAGRIRKTTGTSFSQSVILLFCHSVFHLTSLFFVHLTLPLTFLPHSVLTSLSLSLSLPLPFLGLPCSLPLQGPKGDKGEKGLPGEIGDNGKKVCMCMYI